MTTLQPVRGTRDFYPEEMRVRNWLFDIWRQTSLRFGFEEYDACVLESEDLYIRKAGDEITEQLYSFEDKGGRRIALRPEMTPSLARLILQRKNTLSFPLKWFTIPQCFRYERMTRGRKREHYQWNLDVVGQPDLTAEVEVISALLTSLEKTGLDASHVELRVNDRQILNGLLSNIGIPEDRHTEAMVVIDKREKLSPEVLDQLLRDVGLGNEQLDKLNAFFSAAEESFAEVGRHLGSHGAATEGLLRLLELLQGVGLRDYITIDCTVVRGLSYYTGTVFELRDRAGKFRSICGGGRYDSLLSAFGGESIPAIGFGFGDVVIQELLAELKLLPELTHDIDFAVLPFSEQQAPAALEVAQRLRGAGFRAGSDFSYRKLGRALQRASEIGARKAVLLLPEELERGELVVRDMAARTEVRVDKEEFLNDPE
ncbi:MAG: histidine--tRNA ligase [SAR324 cluster bacterium]|nr:histidine--tRNA ligase [SAR324 cluster bacterium]